MLLLRLLQMPQIYRGSGLVSASNGVGQHWSNALVRKLSLGFLSHDQYDESYCVLLLPLTQEFPLVTPALRGLCFFRPSIMYDLTPAANALELRVPASISLPPFHFTRRLYALQLYILVCLVSALQQSSGGSHGMTRLSLSIAIVHANDKLHAIPFCTLM